MPLFNWFFAKSATAPSSGSVAASGSVRTPTAAVSAVVTVPDPVERSSDDRKVRRHARREQLYSAVRDTMTQSGVLSSSYKFKVLSLDQLGNQFLVMMDVDQAVDVESKNFIHIEAKITQSARTRFEIIVSSVYWRVTSHGLAPRSEPASVEQEKPAVAAQPTPALPKPAAPRYEPIGQDEVAAFRQALTAASVAGSSAGVRASPKTRRGATRSYTLLTGFEDTEMPEAHSAPVLSNTQYGELN